MKARFSTSKASIAVAIVAFVLSLVPFSGITTPSRAAKSEPVRTEWVAQQRAVTRYVTYYQKYATAGNLSYTPRAVQHHTRLIALIIASCARSHAPAARCILHRTLPSSDREDPFAISPFIA
jgi:hypothetical protein